jgi:hypothetical protein
VFWGAIMDISPDKQNVDGVFSNTTYYIDFYQREYKWTAEPVRRLLDDIFYAFEDSYKKNKDLEPRAEIIVAKYPWYYLNTYVTNSVDGRVYVVDGQQRLTTLTLILIKLHHLALAHDSKLAGWIDRKIAGQSGFDQQFWMNHERHLETLRALHSSDEKLDEIPTKSGLTAQNLLANYKVISSVVGERLGGDQHKFETFVFFFLSRVVLVNLSVEQTDVPMVFEVINDRGVRLKPYEILKGKLLGQIDKLELTKNDYNGLWERQIKAVNGFYGEEIDDFFRYYLKAKYAESRYGGQRFDTDYHREMFKADLNQTLKLDHNPVGVKLFLDGSFRYYTNLYVKFRAIAASRSATNPWSYFNTLNEMDTQFLLVLSACKIDDPEEDEKIKLVSRHLDRLFVLLRLQRAYDSSEFTDAVFEISKAIRDSDAASIPQVFNAKLLEMLSTKRSSTASEPLQYAFFKSTSITDLPNRFLRYFFARIDEFFATEMKMSPRQYLPEIVTKTGPKTGYHIEHILAYNEENLELYEGSNEGFEQDRNRLGAVLLLKGRDNQSSNAESYKSKLRTYANTLFWNETLRADTYKSKLDFRDLIVRHNLTIRALEKFGPDEVEERQRLLFDIVSIIWESRPTKAATKVA